MLMSVGALLISVPSAALAAIAIESSVRNPAIARKASFID